MPCSVAMRRPGVARRATVDLDDAHPVALVRGPGVTVRRGESRGGQRRGNRGPRDRQSVACTGRPSGSTNLQRTHCRQSPRLAHTLPHCRKRHPSASSRYRTRRSAAGGANTPTTRSRSPATPSPPDSPLPDTLRLSTLQHYSPHYTSSPRIHPHSPHQRCPTCRTTGSASHSRTR